MSARPGTQVNPRSPRQTGSPRATYSAVLRLLSGALAVLGLGGAVATARAQDDSARPRHGYPTVYAVRDARVVAAADRVHAPGTVVVRQGVIEAVGPSKDVAIPLDAEVIEGKGLVVYPGFID